MKARCLLIKTDIGCQSHASEAPTVSLPGAKRARWHAASRSIAVIDRSRSITVDHGRWRGAPVASGADTGTSPSRTPPDMTVAGAAGSYQDSQGEWEPAVLGGAAAPLAAAVRRGSQRVREQLSVGENGEFSQS
jgi:hypothetical protein